MKTTCRELADALQNMLSHLQQAHGITPDMHITMTPECHMDLLNDLNTADYMNTLMNGATRNAFMGQGYSVVRGQTVPYRIWIAKELA